MNGVFPTDVYGLIIDRIKYDSGDNYTVGNLCQCPLCFKTNTRCVHLSLFEARRLCRLAHVCRGWRKLIIAKKYVYNVSYYYQPPLQGIFLMNKRF